MPAIVPATLCCLKTKKAIKLKIAAHSTAIKGVNTFVDTIVAMELAASWKPLVKSKTSAIPMMTIRKIMFIEFIFRNCESNKGSNK